LGTSIFGDNLVGERASSMFFGFLIPFQIYILCRKGNLSPQASFWGALFFAFSPLGLIASILAITDVGMVFFWMCGLIFLGLAFDEKKIPNYYLIGLSVMASALFKWAAFLFWIAELAEKKFSRPEITSEI
jgi:4-amino-4-deoxy-L-arabinose transferase-like glycosyltransferase